MRGSSIAGATSRTSLLAAAACILVFVPESLIPAAVPRSPAGQDQAPSRLWVLAEPDAIVEYDVATFAAARALKIPRRLFEHPEYLSVSARGQMLYVPAPGTHGDGGHGSAADDRVWFWDGQRAREWTPAEPGSRGLRPQDPPTTEAVRQWFLSATGDSLFLFENRFEYRAEGATAGSEPQRSVRASARVWRTDLAGGQREEAVSVSSSGWCRCETGACPETCPEWEFWAPDGVVGDFFLSTRITPGQLQTTYHESLVWRRSGSAWSATPLSEPVERFLAASRQGDALIVAVPDGGCCGWDNEGSDQLRLLQHGKVLTLYDEFARYHNRNYDVSIYPADARLAPGGSMVAYTLVSTSPVGGRIRLSSEGKDDPDALERVRTARAALPAVEVVDLGSVPPPATIVARARLVGWLTERELLVVRDGLLTACDRRGRATAVTPIRVRSAADAFLR